MSKIIYILYLTGFVLCAIMWVVGLWTAVVLAKDLIKPKL